MYNSPISTLVDALKNTVLPNMTNLSGQEILKFGRLVIGLESFPHQAKVNCTKLHLRQKSRPVYWEVMLKLSLTHLEFTAYQFERDYYGDEYMYNHRDCTFSTSESTPESLNNIKTIVDIITADDRWDIFVRSLNRDELSH